MSSAVLKPNIAPMTPQPYRWTCDEYRTLRGAGRFNDRRVMLIEGEILIMPLPDPPHNLSVGLIDDWLRMVFTAGYHVRNQMAFDVGTRNDPGPDLAVVVGARRDLATRQATSVCWSSKWPTLRSRSTRPPRRNSMPPQACRSTGSSTWRIENYSSSAIRSRCVAPSYASIVKTSAAWSIAARMCSGFRRGN